MRIFIGVVILLGAAILAWLAPCLVERNNWWLGFLGSVASVLGILYVILELRGTKRIAIAVRDAIINVRTEYYKSLLSTLKCYLGEVQTAIESRNWVRVTIRLNDVADVASRLAHLQPRVDENWLKLAADARTWASIFSQGRRNQALDYEQGKRVKYYQSVIVRINAEADPLG